MRSPCSFCHTAFTDAHHCKVLLQMTVLRAESLAESGPGDHGGRVEGLLNTNTHMDRGSPNEDCMKLRCHRLASFALATSPPWISCWIT